MPGRRRTGLWIASVLGLAVVGGLTMAGIRLTERRPSPARKVATRFDQQTPLAVLMPELRDSNVAALTALYQRVSAKTEKARTAVTDDEAPHWIDILGALRTGYLRFPAYNRAMAMNVASKILDRFSVEEAPVDWSKTLAPVHDLMASGMADPDLNVRVAALTEVGRLWSWTPGRTPLPIEEQRLTEWTEGLHPAVIRCLADPSPKVRTAAVACLGDLPINSAAAPAIAYLDDMRPEASDVRRQVLVSFARRRSLLSEEAVLKRLYDPAPGIPEMAEVILKTRGLNQEQISLGKMIYHPKPELRASVIPLLRDRTDIDPVIWLLELSHDPDASVRTSAVEALAGRLSPEVRRRLAEMASSDQSPQVREAASKIVPPNTEKTAALPPLPGSPSLNPKAN